MTVVATALHGVTSSGGRVARGPRRRIARGVALGLGGLAAAGALAASATMVAAWMVSGVLSRDPNLYARATLGPRTLALTEVRLPPRRDADEPVRVASGPAETADVNFETKWARAAISAPSDSAPAPRPQVKPKTVPTKVAALTPASAPVTTPSKAIRAPAKTVSVPLPLPRALPVSHEIARAPAAPPKVAAPAPVAPVQKITTPAAPPLKIATTTPAAPLLKLASATPAAPPQKIATAAPTAPPMKLAMATAPETTASIPREIPQPAHEPAPNKVTLPKPGSRIAVYDISAHTVYLPSGEKLEAHSGLGDKMDDPRHVNVRMRGATPPNIYDLRMRESLFHGVPAIRLKPVNEDKMYGRDGILAHTYMLGPNGQSNGCVSFKNYAAFLRAFQKGDFDRLVVVAKLGDTMPDLDTAPAAVRTARATPAARRWRVADSRPAAPKQRALTGQW